MRFSTRVPIKPCEVCFVTLCVLIVQEISYCDLHIMWLTLVLSCFLWHSSTFSLSTRNASHEQVCTSVRRDHFFNENIAMKHLNLCTVFSLAKILTNIEIPLVNHPRSIIIVENTIESLHCKWIYYTLYIRKIYHHNDVIR